MISAIESLATGNSRDTVPDAVQIKYQPLVVVAIALVAGIVFDRFGVPWVPEFDFRPAWLIAAVCLAVWWCVWRGGHPAVSAWLLLGSIAFAGTAWHDLCWNYFADDEIGRYAEFEAGPACMTATVLSAPEILPAPRPTPLRAIPGGERSRLEIELTAIRDGIVWLPVAGRCQLVVNGHLLGVRAGDGVQIFAQFRRPSPPMNPGEFDFAAHARAERRLASLAADSPDCVRIMRTSHAWNPRAALDAIRARGKQLLQAYVGRDTAPLAAAILLGMREDLPNEELLPFFLTGTIHVIVVSGLNVGVLALGLMWMQRTGLFSRRAALLAIMAVVLIYTLVAGAEPPVVRSTVLVVLLCVTAWTGRRAVAFNALAAAAVIVLAFNPSELFQTGTQLSFLCVAILIWASQQPWGRWRLDRDPLDRLIAESRPWYVKAMRSVAAWTVFLLLTSAVVWLATLPLVLERFHLVSPVALLIAPAVWLLALVAMWAGFLTLACGWWVPIVAVATGATCRLALVGLVAVVNWADNLPGGHFWAPGPARWWVIGFYFGFVAIMLWGRSFVSPRWQVGLLSIWIAFGLAPPIVNHWSCGDELRCTFVAVGHGACVVLETPDGQTLVYDAGSLGSPEYATEAVAGYLWQRGIMHIDGIILSHADVDHYNAVPGVIERFGVGTVYVSPMMFDWFGATGPSDAPRVLHDAIQSAGIPLREIWAGDRLRIGDVTVNLIHPPRKGVVGSDNANSITAVIEYEGARLLLTGDLESPGLEDVIAELPVDCDVLLAPHHGSRRSDPPGIAAWSTPEWVVISGGADADHGVEATYVAAGAKVLNTGKLGAIEITVLRDNVVATSFRSASTR